MSLWIYGRKKGGRRSLYSASLPLFAIIVAFGMVIALILRLIR